MADTHKSIDETVEIKLDFKFNLTRAHFYGERTEEQLKVEIEEAKIRLKYFIVSKLQEEYCNVENLSQGKHGYVNFDFTLKVK